MQKSTSGFTIIELVVIIIVIGIIAAIAIVSYGNFQKSTLNSERITELRGWAATFERYKAANGQYPVMPSYTIYCLGEGPDTSQDWCHPSAVDPTTLMNDLAPYNPPPQGPRISLPATQAIGPYAEYTASYIRLITMIEGDDTFENSTCPDGTKKDWGATNQDGVAVACLILLDR